MRHFLSVITLSLLLFVGASASAQTLKFGHIDFQGLVQSMPERDKQATITDAIRQAKEADIQSLQERISTFQQQAQENLQKEESKQFQPIVEKARKAIGDVAKEQGMLYVFEVSQVIYYNTAQSVDMMPLVKTKLGLK